MIYEFPISKNFIKKKFTFILKFYFEKLKFKMKKNFNYIHIQQYTYQ